MKLNRNCWYGVLVDTVKDPLKVDTRSCDVSNNAITQCTWSALAMGMSTF